jgi:hypothetical protein
MKTYTYIIGSEDDFDSSEDLQAFIEDQRQRERPRFKNFAIFEFECPADCSDEIVTMIGRGYAFSNDWGMDGTVSYFIQGEQQ